MRSEKEDLEEDLQKVDKRTQKGLYLRISLDIKRNLARQLEVEILRRKIFQSQEMDGIGRILEIFGIHCSIM